MILLPPRIEISPVGLGDAWPGGNCRRDVVITRIIPILDPLPDVAGHVQRAVLAGSGRVAPHRDGVAQAGEVPAEVTR